MILSAPVLGSVTVASLSWPMKNTAYPSWVSPLNTSLNSSLNLDQPLPYPRSPRSSIPFCWQIYFLHLSAAISQFVILKAFYLLVLGVSSHYRMLIHSQFSIPFNLNS